MFSWAPDIYCINVKILDSRNSNAKFLKIFSLTPWIILKFKFLEKQCKALYLHTLFCLLTNTILRTVQQLHTELLISLIWISHSFSICWNLLPKFTLWIFIWVFNRVKICFLPPTENMWQCISICSPIIWSNLQNSDNPSPPLWLYPKFTIICVSKAAVSVEDPHIKSMQKLVSFLVPSAGVTACCQPQLLERQVQQIFFSHNSKCFNRSTGQLSAQMCVSSHW